MGTIDVRKLKDQATRALEKKQYQRAADLYMQIAGQEPEQADWRQRAGEALRKAGDVAGATEQLLSAAEGYANNGHLIKAIAVCKVVLQLDPGYTAIQPLLADLYARRDRGTRPPREQLALARSAKPGSEAGSARLDEPSPSPSPRASSPPPLPAPLPPPAPSPFPVVAPAPFAPLPSPVSGGLFDDPLLGLGSGADALVSLDELSTERTIPPGAPIEVVPLHEVLGGRKREPTPIAPGPDHREHPNPGGAVYEITLDDSDMIAIAPPPAPPPRPPLPPPVPAPRSAATPRPEPGRPAASVATAAPKPDAPAAELDFSDLMDESTAAPVPEPARDSAARPEPAEPPAMLELDFSGLMEDPVEAGPVQAEPPVGPEPELPLSPLVIEGAPLAPPPPQALPQIPLFSSLDARRLLHLIRRVEMHEYAPDEVIVREGERGRSLFVVARGAVSVVAEGPPRRVLARIEEGAFFGELGVLTDFPRSATVLAAMPTEVLEISRELLSELVADSPEVLRTLMRFFRDRLLDRLLGSSSLFAGFARDDAHALAERFVFLELEPAAQVVRAGERAPGMFLLLCGEAQVRRGRDLLARLGPGDVFGEMSLLDQGPATADIETLTKCWALELPRERFQEIVLSYPQVLEYVSELVAARKAHNQSGSDDKIDFL